MPAARESAAARSTAGLRDQTAWPRCARSTASATCAAVAAWAWATIRVGCDGSTDAKRRPSTTSSPISIGTSSGSLASTAASAASASRRTASRRSSSSGSLANVVTVPPEARRCSCRWRRQRGRSRWRCSRAAGARGRPCRRRDRRPGSRRGRDGRWRRSRPACRHPARAGSGTRGRRCRRRGRPRRPRRRRSSAGCARRSRRGRIGVASIRRLDSVSKLRSHARRSVKTGGVQPCCAAWTTSWSQ